MEHSSLLFLKHHNNILKDLLVSLSTLLHGTLYDKLMWTFRMYDLDGDGVITKVELGNVVVGIYELMGIILLPQVMIAKVPRKVWILIPDQLTL